MRTLLLQLQSSKVLWNCWNSRWTNCMRYSTTDPLSQGLGILRSNDTWHTHTNKSNVQMSTTINDTHIIINIIINTHKLLIHIASVWHGFDLFFFKLKSNNRLPIPNWWFCTDDTRPIGMFCCRSNSVLLKILQ